MRVRNWSAGVIALAVLSVVGQIVVYGVVIYIAWHFLQRFW